MDFLVPRSLVVGAICRVSRNNHPCAISHREMQDFFVFSIKIRAVGSSFPTEGSMKILKMAALLAIATLPLLLARKEKEDPKPLREVDSDHIFDEELSID